MQIKTANLTGPALAWAVADAQGVIPKTNYPEADANSFLRALSKGGFQFATPGPGVDRLIQEIGIDLRFKKGDAKQILDMRHFDPSKGDSVIQRFNREMVSRPAPHSLDGKWMAMPSTTDSGSMTRWSLKEASLGDTPTEAAMRCYVNFTTGPTVEIPDAIAKASKLEATMSTPQETAPQQSASSPLNELIDRLNEQRTLLEQLSKSYGPLDHLASQAKSSLHKLLDGAEKLLENSKTVGQYRQELGEASPVSFTVSYNPPAPGGILTTGKAELQSTLPDGTLFTNTHQFHYQTGDLNDLTLQSSQLDTEAPTAFEIISFDNNRLPITVDPSDVEKLVLDAIPDLKGKAAQAIQQADRLRRLENLAQECISSGDQDASAAFASEADMTPAEFTAKIQEHGYSSQLVSILTPEPEATQTLEAQAPQKPQEPTPEPDSGPSLG